jgi:SAM-dependent methyltransferase
VSVPYTARFYARHRDGSASSARVILPLVREWVSPRSVVDVGCGAGTWLEAWREIGVEDVIGVDGGHVADGAASLCFPADRFVAADLARPFDLGRTFDLAMSLEVAEHLPRAAAGTFVSSLVGLAPVVLFSAAIPFQGGTGHVNEQWPAWWAARFAERGYRCADVLRGRIWADERVAPWYAQNTVLYVREGFARRRLSAEERRAPPGAAPAPLVHPHTYLRHADPGKASVRRALRSLGGALRRRLPARRAPGAPSRGGGDGRGS